MYKSENVFERHPDRSNNREMERLTDICTEREKELKKRGTDRHTQTESHIFQT